VTVVVIDILDEKFFPGRRFIFHVLHAEVDDLVAGLQHGTPLLEINGFRASFDKEELVNEEIFMFSIDMLWIKHGHRGRCIGSRTARAIPRNIPAENK
jgi:hypothetical protein